jgi:hypothetical protein
MTSTEIRKMQTETAKDSMADLEAVKVTALLEIAYQLSLLNECVCGHPLAEHVGTGRCKACSCALARARGRL